MAKSLIDEPIHVPTQDEVKTAINAVRFMGQQFAKIAIEDEKVPEAVASARFAVKAGEIALALDSMLGNDFMSERRRVQ